MTFEVCLGCHTEWYTHLIGVKNIIMSTRSSNSTRGSYLQGPDALKQSSEGQWILRSFAYHDILGSITLGKQPLIDSQFLHDLTDTVNTYLDVGFGILVSKSDITFLGEQCLLRDYIRLNETNLSVPNCFGSI